MKGEKAKEHKKKENEKGTRKEHIKGERRGERRERLLTGEDSRIEINKIEKD